MILEILGGFIAGVTGIFTVYISIYLNEQKTKKTLPELSLLKLRQIKNV
jgi:hypothetical protein